MANLDVLCLATATKAVDMKPWRAQRRPVGESDILIDMKYCGVCHSDLHFVKGDLSSLFKAQYPFCPGHELSGVVAAVGAKVTKFKVGDHAGVGCMVDSCMECSQCKAGEEQKCKKGQIATYGAADKYGRAASPAGYTLGGYTDKFVVHEHFAIVLPKSYPLEKAGPVMCSGVTLYDPMRAYGAGPGTRVGVIGLGGLGGIGVKIAKALGCTVTAVTRGAGKADFATRVLGADTVVISSDPASMAAAKGSIDLLLNTIPFEHDFLSYNALLAPKGRHVVLGLNTGLIAGMAVDGITCGRSRVKGSGIGGIRATQEVIDLCAKHGIYPETQIVGVERVNEVFEKLEGSNESGERYVIDLATLNEGAFAKCAGVPAPKLGPSHPMGLSGILGSVFKTLLWG